MKLFPAIDLRGGKAVRLLYGDYDRMTVYGDDPVETALRFHAQGAGYLHVVDLDGAKDGTPVNASVIQRIAKEVGMFLQVGGGIRDEERIVSYLDSGVDRVVLGTVAVRNFNFVEQMVRKYGAAIAVGVDARAGRVAVSGWLEETELDSLTFCRRCAEAGVQTVIYTDIGRDGALLGSNLPVYQSLGGIPGLQIVASGGVSSLDELRTLATGGTYGAIVGKALYEGVLDLKDCLVAAEG